MFMKTQEHTPLIQLNTITYGDVKHNRENPYKSLENQSTFENHIEQDNALYNVNEKNNARIIECYDGQLMNSCVHNNEVDLDFIKDIMRETNSNDLNSSHDLNNINRFKVRKNTPLEYIPPKQEINTNFNQWLNDEIHCGKK